MRGVVDPIQQAGVQEFGEDQRKEPRRTARGKVSVQTERSKIEGQLVDVSDSGFRMAHADASLEPGQVLKFTHREAQGRARVIWNRIMSGRVETGFLIVQRG
jgi:hypothetical protein